MRSGVSPHRGDPGDRGLAVPLNLKGHKKGHNARLSRGASPKGLRTNETQAGAERGA